MDLYYLINVQLPLCLRLSHVTDDLKNICYGYIHQCCKIVFVLERIPTGIDDIYVLQFLLQILLWMMNFG